MGQQEWVPSFGLGMYLDVPHTLPMLIGGVARDRWEDKKLQPRIDALKETEGTTVAEKQRALNLAWNLHGRSRIANG